LKILVKLEQLTKKINHSIWFTLKFLVKIKAMLWHSGKMVYLFWLSKIGYTDMRGRFDYALSSSGDID